MKKCIKAGVVGYGGAFNMARAHLEQMRDVGMCPTAVAEIDPERLQAAVVDFPGIQTYNNLKTMLQKSDVEIIAIVTPHNTHAALAMQCLKAKRHVICEKPMAITTAECDKLIAAAAQNNVLISTYHNRHWDGCILRAMEVVKSGAIGDILRVDLRVGGHNKPRDWWRSSKSISGGILYDWGVHALEYALQVFNHYDDKMVEVSGYAWNGYWASHGNAYIKDANEDEAQVTVRFASGARLNLTGSNIDCNVKRGMMEIVGTEGNYVLDGLEWQQYKVTEKDDLEVQSGQNPPSEWSKFYENIEAHLTHGKKLIITPEWARRPIHILDLAHRSAKQAKALKTKYE